MQHVIDILKQRFSAAFSDAFGIAYAHTDPMLGPSTNPTFGDYQANVAMSLAKQLHRRPRDVAETIVRRIDLEDVCTRIEMAGPGFINLKLRDDLIARQIAGLARDKQLGVPPADPAQTVVVDYSGPNMGKEMHIGHIRTACIGDCIARVLQMLGHQVVRQNHLGDWGTQFGMLLEYLIETGWDRSADHAIRDLDSLYQQSQKRFESEPDFADRARKRVVALQNGDEQSRVIWQLLITESVHHMNAIHRRLGLLLTDEDIRPESFYQPMLSDLVAELEHLGLLKDSQGAKVFFSKGFVNPTGDPVPIIVQKSDGAYLYATTDLAAARYRIQQIKTDWIIYVTDPRQAQHFAIIFQVVRQAGWGGNAVRLDHVPFGTILGQNHRPFKTREGGTVRLADVLDEAEQRAGAVIDAKNPDLTTDQRTRIASAVGIGALKYADLSSDRIKDYVFDWDRMLSLEGNTSPYLQNAYVRIRSIFRKGDVDPAALGDRTVIISHPAERVLALKLLQFPAAVCAVGQTHEPHRLCSFLYDLAASYHQFYERCPVLAADDQPTRSSRLRMCATTADVLKSGLGLLGIDTVEQM